MSAKASTKPEAAAPAKLAPATRNAFAGRGGSLAPRSGETYTTGEMARLSNNTLRTVRFYEEAGLLQPIGRTDGGHRVFEKSQLERLMWISDMREAGMSLEQIRTLLDMKQKAGSGGEAAKNATSLLRKHIDELRAKIEVLARLSDDLERTVDTAAACISCQDTALFPNQCGECGRLPADRPIPRGMRVLWDIREGRGRGSNEPPGGGGGG